MQCTYHTSVKKRPLIILGETNAGKSRFLNVLLGVDLLPTAHQSSTSVFCEIHYAEEDERHIVVHYLDESNPPEKVILQDPSTAHKTYPEQIAPYVQQPPEKRGKEVFPVKKVDIFWNVPLLKVQTRRSACFSCLSVSPPVFFEFACEFVD